MRDYDNITLGSAVDFSAIVESVSGPAEPTFELGSLELVEKTKFAVPVYQSPARASSADGDDSSRHHRFSGGSSVSCNQNFGVGTFLS